MLLVRLRVMMIKVWILLFLLLLLAYLNLLEAPFSKEDITQMQCFLAAMKQQETPKASSSVFMVTRTPQVKKQSGKTRGISLHPSYVSTFCATLPSGMNDSMWIIDTRASDHVVCSLKSFTSYYPMTNRSVNLPDVSELKVSPNMA